MSEVTVFEDKFVLKFVLVGALFGLVVAGYSVLTNDSAPPTPWWGYLLGALAVGGVSAFLSLLVFGATMPIIAWYKYFRAVKGMNPFEAVAMVAGGLCIGAVVGGGGAWLSNHVSLIAVFFSVCTLFAILSLPYYWIVERKARKHLNVIDVKKG